MVGTSIEVGQTILDRYQVIERIGQGGMANVWLARDERLGKLWAIKEIKPNTRGTRAETFRQALVDEANLMKRLDHPSIPRVVDIVDTGATTFVVMDYVEGTSLATLLRARNAPFDEEQVIAWGMQLCDVLGYLHACHPKIIYCDLKPSNVIAREDGSLRLIDFGIAREEDTASPNEGRVVGTPGYAAPEQVRGMVSTKTATHEPFERSVDERSDIYALGATLYTLVTAHAPALARGEDGRQEVSFAMRPIRQWDARLSEGLERIIARSTRERPSERYQSMREMGYDLAHYTELTQEWRLSQKRKVRRVRRRALAAAAFALAGAGFLMGSAHVGRSTFEHIMYEARSASTEASADEPSDAERLLTEAIALNPSAIEPYERLLSVYEADYRLTDPEARRLQATCGRAQGLEQSEDYAQLCFDVGICYLSYYGADFAGGSVGNMALASSAAAIPWFERAVAASEAGTSALSAADAHAAATYVTLASFYDEVSRASKEGRASEDTYRSFWEALETSLEHENAAPAAQKSTEGMRVRLCQMASETLSSSGYLTGLSRAGVTREEMERMLTRVRTCLEGLQAFGQAEETREVYGPVFSEIDEGLSLADETIRSVFENPVQALQKEEEA